MEEITELTAAFKRAAQKHGATYGEMREAARIAADELGILKSHPRRQWADLTDLAIGEEVLCIVGRGENAVERKAAYLGAIPDRAPGTAWVRLVPGGRPTVARILA